MSAMRTRKWWRLLYIRSISRWFSKHNFAIANEEVAKCKCYERTTLQGGKRKFEYLNVSMVYLLFSVAVTALIIPFHYCLRLSDGIESKRIIFSPPWCATPLFTYAVDDAPGEYLSTAHVDHPLSRVYSELQDPFGALGIWPSSAVACEVLHQLRNSGVLSPGFSMLELGAGAGAPSLTAIGLNAGLSQKNRINIE